MTMDAVFIIVSYLTIMRFHLIVLPDSCSVRVRLGGYGQWLLFFSSSQKGAFLKVFGIPSILEGKIHKDGATCSCLRSGLMCSYLLAFDFLQLSQYFFFFWLPFLFLLWCWEIKLRFCTCQANSLLLSYIPKPNISTLIFLKFPFFNNMCLEQTVI